MKVAFHTRELQRAYADGSEAQRLWGATTGRRYQEAIGAILRTAGRADLYALRQLRLHPLSGQLSGQHAIGLAGVGV